MHKKHVAMCAALAVFCVSLPPLSASAKLSDDDAYRYYDNLRATMEHYDLTDTTIDIETDVAYFFGIANANTADAYYMSCLWCGNKAYRTYYGSFGYDYYTKDSVPLNYGQSWVGYGTFALFLYDDPGYNEFLLLAGQTTNLIGYDTISPYTDTVSYSTATSLDALLESIAPAEPTEPTTTDTPDFTLPNEWIDGGETLALATVEDFSMNESEAFAVLDSVNLDDIESNTGLQNGFGVIWSFVSELWAVFSIGGITLVCLLIMLLSWFFGRRL